jgi:hypothetical protein
VKDRYFADFAAPVDNTDSKHRRTRDDDKANSVLDTGQRDMKQTRDAGEPFRVSSPAPRDVWLAVLESDPLAFVYQTPAGMDALCAAFDAEDASRLYEFAGGRQLILPLYRRRGLPQCLTVERSPLIGSLVSPGPVSQAELRAIFADLGSRSLLRTLVRPSALTGDAWASAAPPELINIQHRSHVLNLHGGFETVWEKRFNSQARRAVRKAEKAQLEVECDSTGKLMPIFYELLQRSVERWATDRHEPLFLARWWARRRDPIGRFQRMSETLGDAYRVWVATVDGKPAAAIVVLFGANAHFTRGAMDKDLAGPVRASFLLQKLAIEEACKAGCRYYNMGETGSSETLARFKSHFGAQPYVFSEYRFEHLPFTRIEVGLRDIAKRYWSP